MAVKCVHCGEMHGEAARFCPTTGRPLDPPLPAVPSAPELRPPVEKGVFDLLKEAMALYRRHARAILITAAALFVPASFINACAVSVIAGPALEQAGEELGARREVVADLARQLERTTDPEAREQLRQRIAGEMEALGREAGA